jgi:hypothetical protein
LQEFIVGENNNAKLLAASPVASGVIIYNSPVRRGLHQLLRERTNVPVLIVGGAMDGSNRIFRYAEDYFLLKLAPEDRQSAERFLLTILPFHGFCSVVDSTKG